MRDSKVFGCWALCAAAAAFAVLLSGCGRPAGTPEAFAPSPLLAFLKAHSLDGKVALIQFGQVGCEMSGDGFNRMVRMTRDKTIPGLSFLRADATPAKEQADEYFRQSPPGFPVVRDEDRSVAKQFGATAIPTTVLVDKFGRVRYRGKFPDERKLADWVQALVEQKSDAGPDVTLFGVESANRAELLPVTKLPDLKGSVRPLGSYAGAKGLLVIFADVSCPFAAGALGELPKVGPKMSSLGVATVVVNICDAKEDVLKTYAKRDTGTPVLYDDTDATKDNWKIEQVPTVVLFGPDGKVAYEGVAVWKDMAKAAEKALGLASGSLTFEVQGTGMG